MQQQRWTKTTLGDIAQWSSGIIPEASAKEYYHNGTIPLIKSGDLKDNINININDIKYYITEEGLKVINNKLVPVGTVLIASVGSTIGKCAITGIESVINSAMKCAIVDDKKIINYYLYFYLISQYYNIRKLSAGGSRQNLFKSQINTFPISLPPLEEQQTISSILKQAHMLNKGLNKGLNKELNNVTLLFKSLLNKLLIPKPHWTKTTLGNVLTYIKRGITPKYIDEDIKDLNNTVLIINQKCVRNTTININHARRTEKVKSLKEEKYLQYGDILLNSLGTGTLGRVGFVDHNIKHATYDSCVILIRANHNIINPRFLLYILLTLESTFISIATGTTNQISIYPKDITGLSISIPSLEEQEKIVNVLSSVQGDKDSLIRLLKDEINAVNKLFRSLLFSLMDEGSDMLRKVLLLNK